MEEADLNKMRSKLDELNKKISSRTTKEKNGNSLILNPTASNQTEETGAEAEMQQDSCLLDNYFYKDPLLDQMNKHQSFAYSLGLELALDHSMNFFEAVLKPSQTQGLKDRIDDFNLNIKNKREFFTKFNSNKKLVRTVTKKFKFKQLECESCGFKTESKLVLDTHLAEPHSFNNFNCNFCDFKSRSKEHYMKHVYEEHSRICKLERPYTKHMCNICDYQCNSGSDTSEKLMQHMQLTCPFRPSNLTSTDPRNLDFNFILANLQSPSRIELLDYEYLFEKKPIDPYIKKYDLFFSKTSQSTASSSLSPNIPVWQYHDSCQTQEKVLLHLIESETPAKTPAFPKSSALPPTRTIIRLEKPVQAVKPIQLVAANETPLNKLENSNIILNLPSNLTTVKSFLPASQIPKPVQNSPNIKLICLPKPPPVEEPKKLSCELCSMKFIGGLQISSFILHLKEFHKITNPTELNSFVQRSLLNNTTTSVGANSNNNSSQSLAVLNEVLSVKRKVSKIEDSSAENSTAKRSKPIILTKVAATKHFINGVLTPSSKTANIQQDSTPAENEQAKNAENDSQDVIYLPTSNELNYENERKFISDQLNKLFNLKSNTFADVILPEKFNLNINKLFEVKSVSGKCYGCNTDNNENLIQHLADQHSLTPKKLANSNTCICCGLECVDKERFIMHQFNAHGLITFTSMNKLYSISNLVANKYNKTPNFISNLDKPTKLNTHSLQEDSFASTSQSKVSSLISDKLKEVNRGIHPSTEKICNILSVQSSLNKMLGKKEFIPLDKEWQEAAKNKQNNSKIRDAINLKVDSNKTSAESVFKCAKCTKIFSNKDKLLKHIRNEHLITHIEIEPQRILPIINSEIESTTFIDNDKASDIIVEEKRKQDDVIEIKETKIADKTRKEKKNSEAKLKVETFKCEVCKKEVVGKKADYENHIKANHLRGLKIKLKVLDKKEVEQILNTSKTDRRSSIRKTKKM